MSLAIEFRPEGIDPTVFVARGAIVLGDVLIGPRSSVWFNAVIRGDSEAIRIGAGTNIQDGAILHADPGFPCVLGDHVTVGHGAIVHGAQIADEVLIGMRAVVLNGAQIGPHCLIGAGALIPEGFVVPPNSLVLGMPGRVQRALTEADHARIAHAASHYAAAAEAYRRARA
ncbi:MAG TPA: gamma carbonic anhydrase family protein [Pirellulales bacterium]|jgi:carbonic anhydrase/acetyltransferase-like protein (isoleucine patch superfamily)|nr:gamma carbonic anhydrase family protein [Pirellulales bacterium]